MRARVHVRDSRILAASGLAMLVLGISLAALGLFTLADMARIAEALEQQSGDIGQPLPSVLPTSVGLYIARVRVLAAAVFVYGGLLGVAGLVLALTFGPVALRGRPPFGHN